MTNKEAIMTLKANYPDACYGQLREAVDAAIEALKAQDADSDTISRKAAIDVCNKAIDLWQGQLGEGIVIAVRKKIEDLPSAQPDFSCDGCQTPKHICGICMRNYPNITDHYCTGEWAERRTDETDYRKE